MAPRHVPKTWSCLGEQEPCLGEHAPKTCVIQDMVKWGNVPHDMYPRHGKCTHDMYICTQDMYTRHVPKTTIHWTLLWHQTCTQDMVRKIFRKFFARADHVLGNNFDVLGAGTMSWVHLNDIVGATYIYRGEHQLPCLGYMSWAHLNDIVGAIYDIVGNTNYHVLGTCRGHIWMISWVQCMISWGTPITMSWIHVVGTYLGYRNLCRGYICWILTHTSWIHIVDTYLGYISWTHIVDTCRGY